MDPLQLTLKRDEAIAKGEKDPLLTMVEAYRAARAQFMLGQKQAGATKHVVAKGPKGSKDLSLEDLGL